MEITTKRDRNLRDLYALVHEPLTPKSGTFPQELYISPIPIAPDSLPPFLPPLCGLHLNVASRRRSPLISSFDTGGQKGRNANAAQRKAGMCVFRLIPFSDMLLFRKSMQWRGHLFKGGQGLENKAKFVFKGFVNIVHDERLTNFVGQRSKLDHLFTLKE